MQNSRNPDCRQDDALPLHAHTPRARVDMSRRAAPVFVSVFLAAMMLASGPASAADKAGSGGDSAYQREVAACNNGSSNQDRATCLKEAGAARGEARKNQLDSGNAAYGSNASDRCKALPSDQRDACMQRMQGQGSVEGTVGGGGVVRELVVPEVRK
jgi:hypothetical protein